MTADAFEKDITARTVAVAESLTGGMVSSNMVSRAGASGYFLGGTVAYTFESKVSQLKVDPIIAELTDCVSEQVAAQMATGVADLFNADAGLATTGYADPAGDQPQMAYVGLYLRSRPHHTVVRQISNDLDTGSPVSRNEFRRRVTHLALAMLSQYTNIHI
jgi:nicotinamide-nucleotide amidase